MGYPLNLFFLTKSLIRIELHIEDNFIPKYSHARRTTLQSIKDQENMKTLVIAPDATILNRN